MKKTVLAFFFGIVLTGTAFSFQNAVKRSRYSDEVYKYVIDTPRFKMIDENKQQSVVGFMAPAETGLSANLNVLVERRKTTREAHRKLSIEQLKAFDVNIIADKDLKVSGRDAYSIEFEGILIGNRPLHYLNLIVVDIDRVYVITCTALPDNFAEYEKEFRACLDSFRPTQAIP